MLTGVSFIRTSRDMRMSTASTMSLLSHVTSGSGSLRWQAFRDLYEAHDLWRRGSQCYMASDQSGFLYTSEQDGTFNVYRAAADGSSNPVQLTHFKKHPCASCPLTVRAMSPLRGMVSSTTCPLVVSSSVSVQVYADYDMNPGQSIRLLREVHGMQPSLPMRKRSPS